MDLMKNHLETQYRNWVFVMFSHTCNICAPANIKWLRHCFAALCLGAAYIFVHFWMPTWNEMPWKYRRFVSEIVEIFLENRHFIEFHHSMDLNKWKYYSISINQGFKIYRWVTVINSDWIFVRIISWFDFNSNPNKLNTIPINSMQH